jgi:hypothetical protein
MFFLGSLGLPLKAALRKTLLIPSNMVENHLKGGFQNTLLMCLKFNKALQYNLILT